jgi:hypothetical protein
MRYSWKWPEIAAVLIALLLPPALLQHYYGVDLFIGLAGAIAIMLPIMWVYERRRERQSGLAVSSFGRFLRGFIGG